MKRTTEQIYEELLVLRCQSGDTKALQELIERWQVRLLRIIYRLSDGHDDSTDIVQEVWINVVKKIKRLDDPACFPQWIYRIATARTADWIRKKKRDRNLVNTVIEKQTVENMIDDDNEKDSKIMIRTAIKQLPTEQQLILTLFYIDELSLKEISASLTMPVGTVKSRLFNARNKLRKLLIRSKK